MADLVQDIDPLQISFSNEKGFQPSTPSQGSPPNPKNEKFLCNTITTPLELFYPKPMNQSTTPEVVSSKFSTPRSQHSLNSVLFRSQPKPRSRFIQLKHYETRYQSSRKSLQNTYFNRYISDNDVMYRSVALENQAKERKRKVLRNWEDIGPANHLREIARLNELINKVNTHVDLCNRLYLPKRK